MKLSKTSLAVLVIQVLLVVSIAGKYLYQRSTCRRVWTRTAMYDPELIMRGRYLSMQLEVDGCRSTLPFAAESETFVRGQRGMQFPAKLTVANNKLVAIQAPETSATSSDQIVFSPSGRSCDVMRLAEPVNFYIPEHADSPLPVKPGQELWVEVTVPPKGPPRPIQLALKDHGAWKPLAFQ
jgi:uncharacterized membrane-anchored protein